MKAGCVEIDALLGYIYDECDPAERLRVAQHVQSCAACAQEVVGLRGARLELSGWAPPEVALGFRISQSTTGGIPSNGLSDAWRGTAPRDTAVVPARVAWWRQPMPVWGQAVAATVLFGLGMAAGSRGQGAVAGGVEPTRPRATAVSATDLTNLEERLGQQIAKVRASAASPVAVRASSDGREAELLRQVRQLIRESENRQQESFTVRAAQLVRDAEIQRRVDMAQMQQTLTQVQGTTGEEVRRQREMLNYLVNVSQRR
ncbi:MAG TPA: zf-HC2 domain-containing protein [Vicinamibacterales bacterium]